VRRRNGNDLTRNEERVLCTAVELLRNGTSSFHGYPLAQAMRGDTEMNYATLYRCLDRLEQRGLLASNWRVPDGTAQSRRVYEVTGAGLAAASLIETSVPLSIRAFGEAAT
jgi:PadR family transcriptional regulator, regulatory protein PadR